MISRQSLPLSGGEKSRTHAEHAVSEGAGRVKQTKRDVGQAFQDTLSSGCFLPKTSGSCTTTTSSAMEQSVLLEMLPLDYLVFSVPLVMVATSPRVTDANRRATDPKKKAHARGWPSLGILQRYRNGRRMASVSMRVSGGAVARV